jgi:hypothetical protein
MQAEEWIRLLIAAGAHFAAAISPWDEIPHCHCISPYPELVPSFLVRARLRYGRMLQHVAQRLQAAFWCSIQTPMVDRQNGDRKFS